MAVVNPFLGVLMRIEGSVALVTGANRGLGAAFARGLLDRGAAKVYAAARNPATVADERLVPVRLDLTDRDSIAAAARAAADVTLLVNNAGISTHTPALGGEEGMRLELEVNYLGTLAVTRAFAPILAANGGGTVVNVLSAASWLTLPGDVGYSVSKAALWSATNGLREELQSQGTQVMALHAAFIDTDLAAHISDLPKASPDDIVAAALDGLQAGEFEVLADDVTRTVRAALSGPLSNLYPGLQTT
jgi:NAD(P)-dependent dehydrogenase (short-subunit alcohol dehydrogenase family)